MNHFRRFFQALKNLFAYFVQEKSPPAGSSPEETKSSQEEPTATKMAPSKESEPAPMASEDVKEEEKTV